MRSSRLLAAASALALCLTTGAAGAAQQRGRDHGGGPDRLSPAARAFLDVDRTTAWRLAQRLRLDFPTYHPQGFALVGDRIFMSSVQILEPTVKYPSPVGGYDRTPGRGIGHVFVMNRQGELLRDIRVGEGIVYHPGGLDYDGTSVWVPVAQYRPDSSAIVYRIDPATYRVREAFRAEDHVGGVVVEPRSGRVHGLSWGSRTFYTWTARGRQLRSSANPDHLLDYQDCDYAGAGHQLCGGVTELPTATGGKYELGGLALTRLRDDRIVHEVPFPAFSAAGHVATRNPVALERDGSTLRLLAAPDDGDVAGGTELLVYEATLSR